MVVCIKIDHSQYSVCTLLSLWADWSQHARQGYHQETADVQDRGEGGEVRSWSVPFPNGLVTDKYWFNVVCYV